MVLDIVQRFFVMVILCLVQALVLNRIQLFHCATPLLYVYFAIIFPRNYPRRAIMLWCFALGVGVDAFSNTPGVAAAAMTMVGFLQPYLLEMFLPRDAEDNLKSSAKALGTGKFVIMATLLTLAFCLVFFALESFSFFNGLHYLACVVGSTLLTLALIFPIEGVRK